MKVPTIVQTVGMVLVALGAFLIATWFGFVVAGSEAIVFGVALERTG